MKLSTTTLLEWRYGPKGNMDRISKAGFTALDFGLNGMVNDNDEFNGPDWRARAEEMRAYAASVGLEISQIHAPFSWHDKRWNDPVYYEEVIAPRVLRSLEIAGIFGVKVAVVHPRHQYVYLGHEEEIFDINMKYYRELIPYAKEYGIKIGIENMYQADPRRKFMIADTCSSIPEFIRYIDTLDSDRIVACLDTGHVALVYQKEEPWDFIRALGHDRLQSLHVHDNDYRADQHLLPYSGIINWNEVTKALGEIDYQGDFTYEVGAGWAKNMNDDGVDILLKYYADIGKNLMAQIDANRPVKNV